VKGIDEHGERDEEKGSLPLLSSCSKFQEILSPFIFWVLTTQALCDCVRGKTNRLEARESNRNRIKATAAVADGRPKTDWTDLELNSEEEEEEGRATTFEIQPHTDTDTDYDRYELRLRWGWEGGKERVRDQTDTRDSLFTLLQLREKLAVSPSQPIPTHNSLSYSRQTPKVFFI
jgi:hypothetical protein